MINHLINDIIVMGGKPLASAGRHRGGEAGKRRHQQNHHRH